MGIFNWFLSDALLWRDLWLNKFFRPKHFGCFKKCQKHQDLPEIEHESDFLWTREYDFKIDNLN